VLAQHESCTSGKDAPRLPSCDVSRRLLTRWYVMAGRAACGPSSGRPPTGKIRVPTRADTSGEASRRWRTSTSTSSAMASPPKKGHNKTAPKGGCLSLREAVREYFPVFLLVTGSCAHIQWPAPHGRMSPGQSGGSRRRHAIRLGVYRRHFLPHIMLQLKPKHCP